MSEPYHLTATDIEIIVDKSVRHTLTTLGIDLEDTAALRQVQADFSYMRRQRLGAENIAEWVKKSLITAAITGLLFALWAGVRLALTAKGFNQ